MVLESAIMLARWPARCISLALCCGPGSGANLRCAGLAGLAARVAYFGAFMIHWAVAHTAYQFHCLSCVYFCSETKHQRIVRNKFNAVDQRHEMVKRCFFMKVVLRVRCEL